MKLSSSLCIQILVLICILTPLSFSSFQILNEELETQNHFSLSNLDYIITTNNSQNIMLQYTVNNTTSTQIIHPQNCTISSIDSQYCYQDTLNNHIQSTNASFISAVKFLFSQNNINKTLYLDFISPSVDINYSLNSSTQLLKISVNITDNLNVSSSTAELVYNHLNLSKDELYFNSYKNSSYIFNYSISKSGNYTIEIIATDEAGNEKLLRKDFEIKDIFAPQITNFTLTKGSQDTQFINFNIDDSSSIGSWRIYIDNTEYAQKYSQNETYDTITQQLNTIPQEILIITKDVFNNTRQYNFSNFNFLSIASQEYVNDELIITSEKAELCKLTEGFNKKSLELSPHNSNQFSLDLSQFNLNDDIYSILIECYNNDTINTLTQEQFNIVVDTIPPEIINFEVQANDEGDIKILYGVDSDVDKLELEKNSRTIPLDLDNDIYIDDEVYYDEEYEYQLKAYDKAGNVDTSQQVELSPNKVTIEFDYFTQDKNKNEFVRIQSESNLNGVIEIISQDSNELNSSRFKFSNINGAQIDKKENFEYSISTTDEIIEFEVPKIGEEYSIKLRVEDNFSNTITKRIEISPFSKELLKVSANESLKNQERGKEVENMEKTKNNNSSSNSFSGSDANSNFSLTSFWIFFILVGIVILALFLYIRIESIKNWHEKNKAYGQLTQGDKNKHSIISSIFSSSKKTVSFDKEIHKRIKNKERKDQNRKEEALKNKKKRQEQKYKQKSLYDQEKYQDLSPKSSSSNMNLLDTRKLQKSKKNHSTNQYKSIILLLQSILPTLNSQDKPTKKNENNNIESSQENSSSNNHKMSNSNDIFGEKNIQTSYDFSSHNNNNNEKKNQNRDEEERENKKGDNKEQTKSKKSGGKLKKLFSSNHSKKSEKHKDSVDLDSNKNTEKNEGSHDSSYQHDDSKNEKNQKPNIDWDSYLKKKSKSKRWFLAQREVDSEIKNKYR